MEEIKCDQDGDSDLLIETHSTRTRSSTGGTSTNDTHFVCRSWVSHISMKRLKYLACQFYLFSTLCKPGPFKRPHLHHPRMMAFSKVIIWGRASLPLHPLLVEVLEYFNLAPFQFTPNSFHTMVSFYIAYMEEELGELSAKEFAYMYCTKALARNEFLVYEQARFKYRGHMGNSQ